MKKMILTAGILALSSLAHADLNCRFSDKGVDQMMGLTISGNSCTIGNGYQQGIYTAKSETKFGFTVVYCVNTLQWSSYPRTMLITLGSNGAAISDSDKRFDRLTLTCK